ncbi:MAG: YggS family pyridoxal phosphate-dependent enzyme [Tannerella sp.]|jgi:pyridoxal phosphate enzyme (YggS family)|nr:YggS family pyridoxal phosphate-dependent enzyme [Tannerella sp.]
MSVAQNIKEIKASLPEGVTLVAVSKFHPAEAIQEAYAVGQRIFGESKVQELMTKQPLLPQDIEWHFIGTLQTNKVKYIAPFIHTIQSLDSLKLLEEVDKQAAKANRCIRVFLEVHIAGEDTKHGFSIGECRALFHEGTLNAFPHVSIAGLMGMATFTEDTEVIRNEFRTLRILFDELKNSGATGVSFTELSMGMSDDYPIAIQEGSTAIRVGTLIFGQREY